MAVSNEQTMRRVELKNNLYKLLQEREPDGIPKANLWSYYRSKMGQISAKFYGIKKMHKLLKTFDDMVAEVLIKGQPTIRLKEGYRPEGEIPSEVQMDRRRNTQKESSREEV